MRHRRLGTIPIALEQRTRALHATIEDDGAWRMRRPDPASGRGCLIVEGMVDAVAVDAGPRGTRVEVELRLRRNERGGVTSSPCRSAGAG